jgi:hypothetical protein
MRFEDIIRSLTPEERREIFHEDGKPWTEEDVEYLREWYGKDSLLMMAYALGRTPKSVQSKAQQLGLIGKTVRRDDDHAA